MGQAGRLAIHLTVSMKFTRKVEQNPVGVFRYRAFKRCNDRILLTERPCVWVADACHVKSSKLRRKPQIILYIDKDSKCRFHSGCAGKPLTLPRCSNFTDLQKVWK